MNPTFPHEKSEIPTIALKFKSKLMRSQSLIKKKGRPKWRQIGRMDKKLKEISATKLKLPVSCKLCKFFQADESACGDEEF